MKFVLKCTGHSDIDRSYVARGGAGWSSTVEDATVFDSAEDAVTEANKWSKQHEFVLVPVEVTPPPPPPVPAIRRLI